MKKTEPTNKANTTGIIETRNTANKIYATTLKKKHLILNWMIETLNLMRQDFEWLKY